MFNVHQGQTLHLTSGPHTVIDTRGNTLFLLHESTGETTSMHIGDLPEQLVSLPEDAGEKPVPELINALSADQAELLTFWSNHITEVLDGRHPDREYCKLAYSPTRSKNDRIDAKLTEISEIRPELAISRATWFRKQKAFKQGDIAGVIGANLSRPCDPLAEADPRLIEAITWVISDRMRRSTVTEKELHRLVAQELTLRYRADAPELPSSKTMYRYFDILGVKKYATGTATNRRSQDGVRKKQHKHTARLRPGEEIQLDETKLDILIKHGNKVLRPSLLLAVDVATRSIAGWAITLGAATAFDATLTIAQMLVPFQMRPDDTEQRRLVAALNPDWNLLSPERHREMHLRKARPIPRRIMTDNGKSFTGDTFKAACNFFGIDLTYSAVHTPSDKATVERTFKSINEMFLQDKPGYIGNSTVNKGYKVPEREKLLTLSLLWELLDDWVVEVWQNRPHKSLTFPLEPTRLFTPNQWHALNAELSGGLMLPLSREEFIRLLPVEHRTIQRTGVQFNNHFFDSPELDPLRLLPSNHADQSGEWEIRYVPNSVTAIWLKDRDGRYIECPNRKLRLLNQPHAVDVMNALPELDERAKHMYAQAARKATPVPELTTGEETQMLLAAITGDADEGSDPLALAFASDADDHTPEAPQRHTKAPRGDDHEKELQR